MPTLYINNLNDKVSINKLKLQLDQLFRPYGSILQITAHRNLKMKGQAFVTFETTSLADKAQEFLQNYKLFGKEMHLALAKDESDLYYSSHGETEKVEARKERKRKANEEKKQAVPEKTPEKALEKKLEAPKKKRKLNNPPSAKLLIQGVTKDIEEAAITELFAKLRGYKLNKHIRARGVIIAEFASEADATHSMEGTEFKVLGEEVVVDYGK